MFEPIFPGLGTIYRKFQKISRIPEELGNPTSRSYGKRRNIEFYVADSQFFVSCNPTCTALHSAATRAKASTSHLDAWTLLGGPKWSLEMFGVHFIMFMTRSNASQRPRASTLSWEDCECTPGQPTTLQRCTSCVHCVAVQPSSSSFFLCRRSSLGSDSSHSWTSCNQQNEVMAMMAPRVGSS